MARASLPPGVRFHPTDVELVMYYLKRKVIGKPIRFEGISVIELYKFAPWDLPEKSCLRSKDLEWYFFCPRDRKYTNGPRINRATEIGYWKTTGKDRSVCNNSQTIGMKKTLVFHLGRAPRGDRTNWVMHEYRLEDKELGDKGISQDAYVLCKIFEKSGPGPKNGEQHGAPFREEEWDDDDVTNDSLISLTFDNPSSPHEPADYQNLASIKSSVELNNECDSLMGPSPEHSGAPVADNDHLSSLEYFNVDEMLQELSYNDDDTLVSLGNGVDENADLIIPHTNIDDQDAVPPNGDDIFSGLGDIASQAELNNSYFPNNLEYDLHQMLSDVNHGYFIEMNDIQNTVDPSYANSVISDNSSHTLNVPVSEVDNNGCSLGYQEVMFDPTAQVQKAEETGNENVLQALEGGEQHTLSPSLEHISEEGGSSYSNLQCLLGSIPARPASAAEYSPLKGENLKSNLLSYSNSIHVKAEVTVRCICTGGHLAEQLGNHPCICCYGAKPSKKLGREPFLPGGGFMFVFLLGMVSALVWIFLLAMGAKFGRYAWKNFQSSLT